LERQPSHVAPRPRQTCNQTGAERVACHEHDWDNRCCLLCRNHCGSQRDDNIDFEPHEFGCDLSDALRACLRPSNLDRDVAALDPTEFSQPLYECSTPLALDRRRARPQEPDHRKFGGLLRARRDRPRGCRAAEQGDELAPFHSITSSARASSVGGTVRPSACAVIRLMTSSNFVACSTGRSPGFAPRKILSTYSAARRNMSGTRGPMPSMPRRSAGSRLPALSSKARSATCGEAGVTPLESRL